MKKERFKLIRAFVFTLMLGALSSQAQVMKWGVKTIHGSNNQTCNDVAADGAGNTYSVGSYKFMATFSPLTSVLNSDGTGVYDDGFISKYDRLGVHVWKLDFKNASASNTDERVVASAVFPDGMGSFYLYVVGTFSSLITIPTTSGSPSVLVGGAGTESFVAKYNANGVLIWADKITGGGNDNVKDICSRGGSIYVAGNFSGSSVTYKSLTLNSINGNQEGYLIKLNDAGTAQWGRVMSSTGIDSYNAVACTDIGDVVVTGQIATAGVVQTTSNCAACTTAANCSGNTDAIVTRYTSAGGFSWVKNCGGATVGLGNYDGGTSIAVDALTGNVFIGGYFTGSFYFGMLGPVGNQGTGWDFFIAQLTSGGSVNWFRTGGTPNDGDILNSIAINNLGTRLYCTGNFKGNFGYPTAGTIFSSYSAINLDGFLLTLNASDLTRIVGAEAKFGGSTHDDFGNSIVVNAVEDIYVASTSLSVNWNQAALSIPNDNTSGGTSDCYLLKWDHSNWPDLSSGSNFGAPFCGIGEWTDASLGYNQVSAIGTLLSSTAASFPGVGSLTSTPNPAGGASRDVYLLKANTFGSNSLYTKLMDGSAEENVVGAVFDWQGTGYYVGNCYSLSNSFAHFVGASAPGHSVLGWGCSFIAQCDKAGTRTWSLFIPNSPGRILMTSVTIDIYGYMYVCGRYSGAPIMPTTSGGTITLPASPANGSWNAFVAQYHYSGALQWAKGFSVTSSVTNGLDGAYFNSISVDNAGSYYVTGSYRATGGTTMTLGSTSFGSSNAFDLLVMKGSAGSGFADEAIAYSAPGDDMGFGIISPNPDEVYFTGSKGGSYSINTAFETQRPTTGQAITGSVDFVTNPTPFYNWGGPRTSTTGAGYSAAYGNSLAIMNGYVYVTGATRGTSVLEFGALSVPSNSDYIFLVSYSSWGGTEACLRASKINSANSAAYAIAVESGDVSPDHGDNVLIAGSSGPQGMICKMSTEGCVFSERLANPFSEAKGLTNSATSSTIYPNPFSDEAILQINIPEDQEVHDASVTVFDLSGKIVKEMNGINTKRITISAEGLMPGIYFYQIIEQGTMLSSGKMIVVRD
jgi:hypothetical protein